MSAAPSEALPGAEAEAYREALPAAEGEEKSEPLPVATGLGVTVAQALPDEVPVGAAL